MGLAIFWFAIAGIFVGSFFAWLLGYPYFALLSFGLPGWLVTVVFLAAIMALAIWLSKKKKIFWTSLAWATFVCFLIVRIAA
ncbi:MAG: hypothetical protein IKN74_03285 [Clostridia bacterium]|nr:hypothetical protein [Clostridia bacterium]